VFYIPMLIVLGLVTYIPALTLWLPSVLLDRGVAPASARPVSSLAPWREDSFGQVQPLGLKKSGARAVFRYHR
jgi:hypothetical protein